MDHLLYDPPSHETPLDLGGPSSSDVPAADVPARPQDEAASPPASGSRPH